MRFTKEEIRLCKKLAELGVSKEIKKGDNVLYIDKIWMVRYATRTPYYLTIIHGEYDEDERNVRGDKVVLIWREKDCLKWLKEKCKDHVLLIHDIDDSKKWWCWFDEYHETRQFEKGKTPLEALLKAMIQVVKEGKDA